MDPYERDKAPEAPKTPPRFSPLRPLRLAIWWCLSPFQDPLAVSHPGLVFAWVLVLGAPLFVLIGGLPSERGGVYDTRFSWTVFEWYTVVVGSFCMRLFIRMSMHLDRPESAEWWKERLER